ncbi:MAG: cytochrome b5-like heme/steroid binding domain-containing protein [Gammaproteobacteria bacterium]
MRKTAFVSVIVFWSVVATLWIVARLAPGPTAPSAGPAAVSGDLARHAGLHDCWIRVHGVDYDITDYLARHPAGVDVILPWCGRDATQAFEDLGQGRSHSERARRQLERYRVAGSGAD